MQVQTVTNHNMLFICVLRLYNTFKMPQEKHTEICKEVLFFLWIEDKLFTDEQDLKIELEIERWMKAGVSND